jgi:hypothetical protein
VSRADDREERYVRQTVGFFSKYSPVNTTALPLVWKVLKRTRRQSYVLYLFYNRETSLSPSRAVGAFLKKTRAQAIAKGVELELKGLCVRAQKKTQ